MSYPVDRVLDELLADWQQSVDQWSWIKTTKVRGGPAWLEASARECAAIRVCTLISTAHSDVLVKRINRMCQDTERAMADPGPQYYA